MSARLVPIPDFRLQSPLLGFWVDVRLRSFNNRWIAVAEICGEQEMGLADDPRQALAKALASLGGQAVNALLTNAPKMGPEHELA